LAAALALLDTSLANKIAKEEEKEEQRKKKKKKKKPESAS
jgi:hypothetical protein